MISNPEYTNTNFIKDLARYITPYKKLFFTGVLLRLTSDIANLYPAWAISQLVAILSTQNTVGVTNDIVKIFVLFGLATAYYGITHGFSKYLGYQVAENASLDIYKEGLSHLFKLDFAWQEKENSGNKLRRIDRGLDGVNTTIRRIFDVLIEVVVNTVGIIAVFFTLDKILSLSLVVFIVIYFIVGTFLLKRAIHQEKIVNKSFENLGGFTFESLNNIQTIKALAIDNGVVRLVDTYIRSLVKKIKRRIFLYQSRNAILDTFAGLYGFAAVVFLVLGIIHGKLPLSLLVLFVGLFGKIASSAAELTDVTQQIAQAKIWISRTMAILQTEPKIENPGIVVAQSEYPNDWQEIKISGVCFAYKRKKVLEKVSFNIKRNEKIGIVGLSGAGKSTLFKLLLDLYEDYDGQILIGGTPLKKMKRQSYINHVAVVLQDTELFDMTLKENIEIAAAEKPENENLLEEVIRSSHLEEVVNELSKGVDTVVGEKGIKLSGGQKQRVGIARALYRQPDILLMDEATSHLDAHSEKEIQRAILESMNKFTTIVIAHRLSTIKAMDKIIVLDKGRVVEQGPLEELIAKNGVFAKMWQEQKI